MRVWVNSYIYKCESLYVMYVEIHALRPSTVAKFRIRVIITWPEKLSSLVRIHTRTKAGGRRYG